MTQGKSVAVMQSTATMSDEQMLDWLTPHEQHRWRLAAALGGRKWEYTRDDAIVAECHEGDPHVEPPSWEPVIQVADPETITAIGHGLGHHVAFNSPADTLVDLTILVDTRRHLWAHRPKSIISGPQFTCGDCVVPFGPDVSIWRVEHHSSCWFRRVPRVLQGVPFWERALQENTG